MKAKIIQVDIEETPHGLFTSSPDLRGLVTGAMTRDELLHRLPEAIEMILDGSGESFTVHEAEGGSASRVVFVVVPVQQQLGRCA